MTYATFWKRLYASLLDGIIFAALVFLTQMFTLPLVPYFTDSNYHPVKNAIEGGSSHTYLVWGHSTLYSVFGWIIVSTLILYILYFVVTECSPWQATPGKKIFKLQVTDLNGHRIGFFRSLARRLSALISLLFLGLGYVLLWFSPQKQTFHDKVSNCLVLDECPEQIPGCATGLALFLGAGIAAFWYLWTSIALGVAFFEGKVEADEKANADQAVVLLQQVATAQQAYAKQYGQYATQWSRLQFEGCLATSIEAEKPNRCKMGHFSFVLEPSGVTAFSIQPEQDLGMIFPYSLSLVYTQPDTPVTCKNLHPTVDMCGKFNFNNKQTQEDL